MSTLAAASCRPTGKKPFCDDETSDHLLPSGTELYKRPKIATQQPLQSIVKLPPPLPLPPPPAVSPVPKVATFHEQLKYDRKADETQSSKRSEKPSISKRTKKRLKTLSFDESVEVLPIPMRNEYSNRVKASLWSSAIEIQENAARNTIEFASEGWNWRNVLEDEYMYVCVATSELIRPCHHEQSYQHGFR